MRRLVVLLALVAFAPAVARAQAPPVGPTCQQKLDVTAEYGTLLAEQQAQLQEKIAYLRAEVVRLTRMVGAQKAELEKLIKPSPEGTPTP